VFAGLQPVDGGKIHRLASGRVIQTTADMLRYIAEQIGAAIER
jgi:hypothetical protein